MSLQMVDTEPLYGDDYTGTSSTHFHRYSGEHSKPIQDNAFEWKQNQLVQLTLPNRDSAFNISDNHSPNDESKVLELVDWLMHTSAKEKLSIVFFDSYSKATEAKPNDLDNNIELTAALNDLHNANEEAREEGFPIPSDIAIRNSEELVKNIYEIFPKRFEVYPTQDGEIAVDIYNGKGSSVILLCDSVGEILCMVNISGNSRRAHYSQIDQLPDGFVREALNELSV